MSCDDQGYPACLWSRIGVDATAHNDVLVIPTEADAAVGDRNGEGAPDEHAQGTGGHAAIHLRW